jgi:hypothetical protein
LTYEEPDVQIRAAARDILRYLVEHPGATDTARGIAGWWVTGLDNRVVDMALDHLVNRGWLLARSYGGPALYSLDREQLQEILRFLGGEATNG